jgi:Fe2+ transport system protein B
VICANKIDLEDRKVSKEDGERLAETYKARYVEISAKSGQNLEKGFESLIEM